MGDFDPITGGICRANQGPHTPEDEPLFLASAGGEQVSEGNPFGGFTLAQAPVSYDGGVLVIPGPLGQMISNHTDPVASPIQVNSPHCLDTTVTDLQQIFETMRSGPCPYAMDRILPQIVDHGNMEVQFEAPLNPGTYRGGVVVERPTWLHARLFLEDGRVRGTIDFFPPIVKQGGIAGIGDATLSQLSIRTDPETNQIRFGATATFLNLRVPLIGDSVPMNVTEEVSEMLFGNRMSSIPGPASGLIRAFVEAQGSEETQLEDMINMAAARFRIVANPQEGDPLVPALGDVSNAGIRLDRLEISPTLTLTDIQATIEVWPNEETGGFTVRIPNASIGEIRHVPTEPCDGEPNAGTTIPNVRLRDLVLEMAPTGDRNQLATNMFQAQSEALRFLANFCAGRVSDPSALLSMQPPLYVQSGSGRIEMGRISINDDIVVNPIEGDHAIRFAVSDGQPNGDMHVTVDAPEMGIDRAAVTVGGEILQGHSAEINIDDAILQNLHASLDVQDGTVTYDATFTPSLASAVLNGRDADGQFLAGASLMGFQASVNASGTMNVGTGEGSHRLQVTDATLDPSSGVSWTDALGIPSSGKSNFGFSGAGLDATLFQENFRINGISLYSLALPQQTLGAEATIGGNHLIAALSNGNATEDLPAGVHFIRDSADPALNGPATLLINTRADRIRFTTPQGTFEMTGDLTGTMQVAGTYLPIPPETLPAPNFRPVAGSIRLRLNGTIRQISGRGRLRLSGNIRITDTTSGRLTIRPSSRARVEDAGLGVRTSGRIVVDLGNEVRQTEGSDSPAVPYYDYDPTTEHVIPIPQILLNNVLTHAILPEPLTSTVSGSGSVTIRPDGDIRAEYRLRIPLPDQTIPIAGGTLQIVGGRGEHQGRIRISGENERMRIRIRPPEEIRIATTQTRDGITYEIAGTLTPRGEMTANLNLADPLRPTLRLREPSTPYTLSGDLTVTARNVNGEVIGSGEVSVSTAYTFSGQMENGRARFTLDVPETTLTGTMTRGFTAQGITVADGAQLSVPIRGFHGEIGINLLDLSNPSLTSTWNLPTVGSGDIAPEVLIPGVDIAGFEGDQGQFRDIRANFYLDPQGQQIQVDASLRDGVRIETLPGPNDTPRTMRLTFSVGEDRQRIVIEGTADSRARVDATIPRNGEIVLNVRDLFVDTRTNGQILQPLQLDLNALNTLTQIPGLQVRYNPETNQVRLVANPPTPNLPTPPQTFEEFFSWTPQQWTTYRQALEGETHMIRLSEANVAVQRALGKTIPPGRGDLFVNLIRSIDQTFPVDENLLSNLTTLISENLDMRRALPSPPPCRSGTCAPVVLYSGQNPDGELYFTQFQQNDGQPAISPEVPGILQEALGVDRTQSETYLRDLRISVEDLIRTVRQSAGVADHYSEQNLRDLLESYFDSPVPNGTHRQMELRGLITLANVRRSLTNLLVAQGGLLPVHGHVFRNDDYHSGSQGDGMDMQDLAIVPASPETVEAIVRNMADAVRWDHWVDRSSGSGASATGRLLNGYEYSVSVSTGVEGNVRLVHFHLTPADGSGLVAYTRTVRLVPVTNAIDPDTGETAAQGTLVIFDEHSDFNGADHELPFPRTRIPQSPQITWESFLNGALRAFQPPRTNVARHSLNRFAVTVHNILGIARNPDVSAGELRRSLEYDSSRAEQTATVRRVDFLSLSDDGQSLVISETAQDPVVRSYFEEHLSAIPSSNIDRWLRPGVNGVRQIPLEELRTASGMNQQFTADSFRALARTMLNPPTEMADIVSNFGSTTERFILTLEHIGHRSTQLRDGRNGDVLVFEDDRFHPNISQASRRQGDTVDTMNIFYLPASFSWQGSSMTLDLDRFIETIHHAEYYHRIDPGNFSVSDVVQNPQLSNGVTVDPNRIYTHSEIGLPGGLSLNYLISSVPAPVTVEGVGRLSAWRLEPSPQWNDFSDNTGWWLIVPAEGGGHWFFRAGTLNSRPSGSDNTGTVAETGRTGIVRFAEALISSTLEGQRTGNPIAWTPGNGRAIKFQVGQAVHISQ